MDIACEVAPLHMRTDANNLVTTAQTTHLPEQKETIHMIQMLRKVACSSGIDDLAHVASGDCLSDCLTKSSAKPDALIKAVALATLPNADKNPVFRKLMAPHHKAWLARWICLNLRKPHKIETFFGDYVKDVIHQVLYTETTVADQK